MNRRRGREIVVRDFNKRNLRRLGRAFALTVGLMSILTMKTGIAQNKPEMPSSVLEDWSHEQIAQALGIRVGAAKTRLSRARSRLRQELSIDNPGDLLSTGGKGEC